MSKTTLDKPNPVGPRLVIVGGASEVLDDALKDFIVEWLVPTLVDEYIRIHWQDAIHGDMWSVDLDTLKLNSDAGTSVPRFGLARFPRLDVQSIQYHFREAHFSGLAAPYLC